jgi:hypothetical protein
MTPQLIIAANLGSFPYQFPRFIRPTIFVTSESQELELF